MNEVDELENVCAGRIDGPVPVAVDVEPEEPVLPALVPSEPVPATPLAIVVPPVAAGASVEEDAGGPSTEDKGASGVEVDVATEVEGTF